MLRRGRADLSTPRPPDARHSSGCPGGGRIDRLEALAQRDSELAVTDALWLARGGGRLSSRAIDLVLRRLAEDAGLELSAHVLRHTCVTNLIRSGADVVLVAELAGHRRLDTTRRYSLPSEADREAAVEAVLVET